MSRRCATSCTIWARHPLCGPTIILKYPEALDELPDDLIFVDWNYGWEPDRFGKLANLFSRGVKLWGAPALRSGPDNIYLTQWKKHFDNLAVFVEYAREHDYGGMIETSWSTSGTYGYWFDNGYEILSMQPVRLVYPMSAFRILEAACCEAFVTDAPFEPEAFVRRYAGRSWDSTMREPTYCGVISRCLRRPCGLGFRSEGRFRARSARGD